MLSPGLSALNAEFFTKRDCPEQHIEAVTVRCCTAEAESKQEITSEWGLMMETARRCIQLRKTLKDDGVFTGDFLDEA